MPIVSADVAVVHGALAATPSTTTSTTTAPIFLVPNGTFVVELIMFVIVLGIVAKFILPPIQKAVDDREQRVRGELQAGEEGRQEAARLAAEGQEAVERARAEARTILEEAGRTVEELRRDARQRAQVEHDARLSEAEGAIDTERQRAREAVLARAGDLVVAAAERVVGTAVDPARHRSLIEQALAEAESKSAR
ncbi:MAG TPA: F0F1 ATP synthase subunit B [Acidimicrobiales bacterium]|nr:F0F1 ATP synthase subunit B [Acidimicrobiales bacterium]